MFFSGRYSEDFNQTGRMLSDSSLGARISFWFCRAAAHVTMKNQSNIKSEKKKH